MTTHWSNLMDQMLEPDGPAALVCRQRLAPALGRGTVIFPPTFAPPEKKKKDETTEEERRDDPAAERSRYVIDTLRDGTKICLIDTPGSQANRMEPLFKSPPYSSLVPQIVIQAGDHEIHLLDVNHRVADAFIRITPKLREKIDEALDSWRKRGDANRLAKVAPTSIIFGAWDSRDTKSKNMKLPRLVESSIRAYDVDRVRRAAQYTPPVRYQNDPKLLPSAVVKKHAGKLAKKGMNDTPSGLQLGGIIVNGEIRRDAILNLETLRAIGLAGHEGLPVRRYLLGLALIALVHPRAHNLRQGCLLVQEDPERGTEWEFVSHSGVRDKTIKVELAGLFDEAKRAADAFGVESAPPKPFIYSSEAAVAFLTKEAEDGEESQGKYLTLQDTA